MKWDSTFNANGKYSFIRREWMGHQTEIWSENGYDFHVRLHDLNDNRLARNPEHSFTFRASFFDLKVLANAIMEIPEIMESQEEDLKKIELDKFRDSLTKEEMELIIKNRKIHEH